MSDRIERYFLAHPLFGEKEVSKEEWIKEERKAGFRPPLASTHPDYMKVCATGGFGGCGGIEGRIKYVDPCKEIPAGIPANVSVDELESLMEGVQEVEDENARLRHQNAALAGANARLREQVSDMRSAGEFIELPGEIEIDDCNFATCAYGLEAGSSGFCSADDATGEAGCPAHLKICSACGGSGVEG